MAGRQWVSEICLECIPREQQSVPAVFLCSLPHVEIQLRPWVASRKPLMLTSAVCWHWSKDLLLCGSAGLLRFEARTPLLVAEPAKGRRMSVTSGEWLLVEYIQDPGLGGRGSEVAHVDCGSFLSRTMGCRDDKPFALASGVASTSHNYTFFKTTENYSVKVLINVISSP